MKIGLQVPKFTWPGGAAGIGPKLAEIAGAADKNGFSSLWVMDHFLQVGQGYGAPDEPMLEGYSALAYMTAVTRKVKLGTMVAGAFYRQIRSATSLLAVTGSLAMGAAYAITRLLAAAIYTQADDKADAGAEPRELRPSSCQLAFPGSLMRKNTMATARSSTAAPR